MPRNFSATIRLIDMQNGSICQSFHFSDLVCREVMSQNIAGINRLFCATQFAIKQSPELKKAVDRLKADLVNQDAYDYYYAYTNSTSITMSDMLLMYYVMKKFYTYDFTVKFTSAVSNTVANDNLPHFVNSYFKSSVSVENTGSDDIFSPNSNPNSNIYQFRFSGIDAYDCALWSILYVRLADYSNSISSSNSPPLTNILELMKSYTQTGSLWYLPCDAERHVTAWTARLARWSSGLDTNIDPMLYMYGDGSMGLWLSDRPFMKRWFYVFDEMDYWDSYFSEYDTEIKPLMRAGLYL